MESQSAVQLLLPEGIGFVENDFDEEDIVYEQTNQNEIVELIMAAFQGHDELSDDESGSLTPSDSSQQSSDEHTILNTNNSNNNDTIQDMDEDDLQRPNEFDRQVLIQTPASPVLSTDTPEVESSPFDAQITDESTQAPYLYQDSQNQLCLLCAAQLENLCQEYQSETRALKQQLQRSKNEHRLIKTEHEQEILALHEKLQRQVHEQNVTKDELRRQFELAHEKLTLERTESTNHFNDQLQDYQRKYTDLLTTTSVNQTELERQLTDLTEDKIKIQVQCEELQSEIRALRDRLDPDDKQVNHIFFSSFSQNHQERIAELIDNEKRLIELNNELQQKIQQFESRSSRSDSDSSSSSSETVITTIHRLDPNRSSINSIDKLKRDYVDLEEKYEYEKHELQTMLEQLREDVIDLDRTKQLYSDVCQEKNSLEDKLRSEFELQLNRQLDDLQREYNEKIRENINHNKPAVPSKYQQELEKQLKDLYGEIERIQLQCDQQVKTLNDEIDRLRINDDRLNDMEQGFEQLKKDYSELDIERQDLLTACSTLEQANQTLVHSLDQFNQEKRQWKKHEEKFVNEIQQTNQLNEQLQQKVSSNDQQISLKQDIESLHIRINNYENTITQYEEYRVRLESNLHKLTQQRDAKKVDLRLTSEMLTSKEEECTQTKLRLEDCEKRVKIDQERFQHYETTIQELKRQSQEYLIESQDLNQTRSAMIQELEAEYRGKLHALTLEKRQYEQRLKESNRALDLADCHLQQEIEKIKFSLEQEYTRRYERDQKQHQHDLHQLRQHLTNEIETQRMSIAPVQLSKNSSHEIDEIKKVYRTEIDRLHHENLELSQHQAKLIDTHQKQMQLMKKEMDDGYTNVINDFQREQTRLQTRYDQLKQQLSSAQHIIEQSKSNLNQLKNNHFEEISKAKDGHPSEYDGRHRQENLQHRLENLVRLLEQSNDALNQERVFRSKQDQEYQQTIANLQKQLADLVKQQTKAIDEKRPSSRPVSVPDFTQTGFSANHMRADHLTTVDKLRELFTDESIALLRLTCRMIFDVHHRGIIAQSMDNLEISVKKQIQNDFIRSRNSMIKEIRREIFEKMTHALQSQRVSDQAIDMHLFELDHLLSQLAQDCLDSIPVSSSSPPLTNSSVSLPQSDCSSSEYLYVPPTTNKQPISTRPSPLKFDTDRRRNSGSNILFDSHNSSLDRHHIPHLTSETSQMRMHRSEDDILLAIERKKQINLDETFCENKIDRHQPNVRALAKQFEQISNNPSSGKIRPSCGIQTISDDQLTWPISPIPIASSTPKGGIKRFVQNGLKLFVIQPQQYKRAGK